MVGAAVLVRFRCHVYLDVETDYLQAEVIGKDTKGDFVNVLKNGEAGIFFFNKEEHTKDNGNLQQKGHIFLRVVVTI